MIVFINKNYDNNTDDNNDDNDNIRNSSYILVTFFINNILSFF